MDKEQLRELYVDKVLSMQEIASELGYSVHKIEYWLRKHGIPRRDRSTAAYVKHNGIQNPFRIKTIRTPSDALLLGLGVGIYWGEGNKKNKNTVRVGNTDIQLIRTFVLFLTRICGVRPMKIRYGLQIFNDSSEQSALNHWTRGLNITRNQIMPTISHIKSGKIGTYKAKNQFGVMTVYVFNVKLRNWLVDQLRVPR